MFGVRRFGLDHLSNAAERLRVRGAAALSPAEPDDGAVQIRILTVNDFHGALDTTGTVDGRPAGGAAFLAAHLARERSQRPETSLLVHSGDMVGLTPPLSGLLQDEPTAAFLNRLGFAVGAAGDHEFDEGLDELVRLADGGSHPETIWRTGSFPGLNFPCLAANVLSERTGHPVLPAVRILPIAGVRIGVIGVVSTGAARRLGAIGTGLRFADEAATVNRHVAELRGHHVAAIVVLAHLGGVAGGDDAPAGDLPGFAAALAPEVDVIVAGHTHRATVAELSGKLTIQAHPLGLGYGTVDLAIDRRMNRVIERSASLRPTWHDAVEPDRATTALVSSFERLARPLADTVVVERSDPVPREPATSDACALGTLVADAYRARTGADIALVHPDELRADLPGGSLTHADLYRALPAGHDLLAVRLRGSAVIRLCDGGFGGTRMPRLSCSGATVEIGPASPPRRRTATVRLPDGSRLDPHGSYTVALTGPTLGATPASDVRVFGKALAAMAAFLRHMARDSHPDTADRAAVFTAS